MRRHGGSVAAEERTRETEKEPAGSFLFGGGGVWGEGESRKLRQGESRGNKWCSFKLRSIEERGFFLFLPKGSEQASACGQVRPGRR